MNSNGDEERFGYIPPESQRYAPPEQPELQGAAEQPEASVPREDMNTPYAGTPQVAPQVFAQAAPQAPLQTPPQMPPQPAVLYDSPQGVAAGEMYRDIPVEARPATPLTYQEEAPADRKWMKSPYDQPYETSVNTYTMYTPGVYANNPYAYKRGGGNVPVTPQPADRIPAGRSRSGAVVRTICLILVCVLLSGFATYGVMEFRIVRGDFQATAQNQAPNQVVLGSSVTRPTQNDGISVTTAPAAAPADGMSAQDIYSMACSQVVGINTEIELTSGGFFASGGQASSSAVTGSGFIISSDGYILTNYHVVEEAYRRGLPLKVIMHDKTAYEAQVIGVEEANDVALIKIDAAGLSAVVIADSEGIQVGQRIYAIGNPFGELLYTMTDGIVSALNREVTVDKKVISTFQLSAAVNSGNSGGPVYNTNGEVVGIVSAKIMGNYAEGIGFAIPINDAIAIATELIEHGYLVGRALMGISVQTVSRGQAEYYGWGVEGAYVISVNEGSAADKAGLRVADIITKMGDDDITSTESLNLAKRKYKAGDTTAVAIRRDGEDLELSITFDEDLSAGQPVPVG